MAVFLINICKFNGCGITFPSLTDLIQHIEDTHIDYDPKVVEQKEATQPACLPLSYVLRFISENVPKENPFLAAGNAGVELKRKLAIKHHSYSISSSNRSNTPTGSEMDEDEMAATDSEDSNDSWTTEEFSSEFIMRYGARHSGVGANGSANNEKPFACPVPGCKKRYKNVNGIKYHSKNGHKKDGKVRKGYKCHCGKSYKTATSLKNHAMSTHNTSPTEIQMMTSQTITNVSGNMSPSQSLGSLSPSSMSNMSSNSNNNNNNTNINGNLLNGNTVLQQLTTGIGLISTNGNAGNVSAACPPLTNSLSLQQLNITANNNHNNNNNNNNNNSTITNAVAPGTVMGVNTAAAVATVNTSATPGNNINNHNNGNNNSNNSLGRNTIGLVTIKTNGNSNANNSITINNLNSNNNNNNTNNNSGSSNNSNNNNSNLTTSHTIHLHSNNGITPIVNGKTVAATNLLAANAAASKILKLANSAAAAAAAVAAQQNGEMKHHKLQQHLQRAALEQKNSLKIQRQQQQQQQQQQLRQQQQSVPKLPNLVSLGVLTPSTSPTKVNLGTQQQQVQVASTLNFNQQQQQQPTVLQTTILNGTTITNLNALQKQQHQQQQKVQTSNILLLEHNHNNKTQQIIQLQTQSQQQQQHQTLLPIRSSSPPALVLQQQHQHKGEVNLLSAALQDFSPCPIHHNWRNNNNNISNNNNDSNAVLTTAAQTHFINPITTAAASASATATAATSTPATATVTNNATTSQMRTMIVKTMMPSANAQARSFQPIQTVLPSTMRISPTAIANSNSAAASATAAAGNNATARANNSLPSTPKISPTFIEHKYSANTFKEKFLANLRNNNRGLNTKNIDCETTGVTAATTTMPTVKPVVAGSNMRASAAAGNLGRASATGIGEMCAIQLQLNENCKNNFHKKTII